MIEKKILVLDCVEEHVRDLFQVSFDDLILKCITDYFRRHHLGSSSPKSSERSYHKQSNRLSFIRTMLKT